MRGEYIRFKRDFAYVWGSPPLARGIPFFLPIVVFDCRITPACAGNTDTKYWNTLQLRDHPRLRGEYTRSLYYAKVNLGSPPLARGIRTSFQSVIQQIGITPACAGNTLKKSLIYNLFPISISKFHLVSQTPEML